MDVSAQEAGVEKSIFGVETGFLGFWMNNEIGLSKQFTLRSEIGLNAGILGRSTNERSNLLLTPEITFEPRWYYNLEKRKAKGKNISGNAGDYFAFKTSFQPNWVLFSQGEKVHPQSHLSIIPTWGMRRNIGKHFYIETAVGIGYRHYFGENDFDWKDKIAPNVHLRFGYKF
jgi:hypothetical protein